MSSNRTALALLVVGLLLIPGPVYATTLDHLGGPNRHRSSAGYTAHPIDASNDSLLADRYGAELAFQPSEMKWEHVRADYRAPNQTRDVLKNAVRNGSARTTNTAVDRDLRLLSRNYTLLTREYDNYYAFTVKHNAGTTTVETQGANNSEVAAMVRDRLVVDYANLTVDEQRTFREIRNATVNDDYYRPWQSEPVPEKPIVARDGSQYAVRHTVSVDDFDFANGLLIGIVASLLGILFVLTGLLVGAYNLLRG